VTEALRGSFRRIVGRGARSPRRFGPSCKRTPRRAPRRDRRSSVDLNKELRFDFDFYFMDKRDFALVTFFDHVFDNALNRPSRRAGTAIV
jgi:hypothetical protein